MNQYALLLRGIQESEHMLPTFLNAVFAYFTWCSVFRSDIEKGRNAKLAFTHCRLPLKSGITTAYKTILLVPHDLFNVLKTFDLQRTW